MNIIITNVGRRGYLVDYFKALPHMQGKIFVSDCDPTASGLYGNNDGHFILPKPVDNEELYVNSLLDLCQKHNIEAIIPVIDPEIFILSHYKARFKENGIVVVVSDKRVLDICFDKLKMNKFLDDNGILHPATYAEYEEFLLALQNHQIQFPVVIKPILGSGSVDTYFVDDEKTAKALFKNGMIIQEKLDGVEYGTDTFNSLSGEPLRWVVKRKIAMRSGETDKSISVRRPDIGELLVKVAKCLHHVGNLDADIIETEKGLYVIDLNPRFGGGYPATHEIGVNLVDILYRLLVGESVKPEFENYQANILVMKEIAVRSTSFEGEL